MPSTYAHYRLGQEVKQLLPESEKQVVEAYPELFLIGLHGPDILFYYKPLVNHPVNRIGYQTHERPGKEFFDQAATVIRKNFYHRAYVSYIYGFICHFALDETCHGYIDEKIAASSVSHTEIEVEFDRALMIEDGLNPIRHRLTNHIVPSMKNAEIIQKFFPDASTAQIRRALQKMIFDNNLLIAPSRLKRHLVYGLLHITGNYKEMHGLLVNYEANPLCTDSTQKLRGLYENARELAVRLIHEYIGFVQKEAPLDDIYRYTFGSKLLKEMEETHTNEN